VSPNYWKRQREKRLKKSRTGVAARERLRIERNRRGGCRIL